METGPDPNSFVIKSLWCINFVSAELTYGIFCDRVVRQLFKKIIYRQSCCQGWDKYYPAGKFQWKMLEIAGTAKTPNIAGVANTGIYEQD